MNTFVVLAIGAVVVILAYVVFSLVSPGSTSTDTTYNVAGNTYNIPAQTPTPSHNADANNAKEIPYTPPTTAPSTPSSPSAPQPPEAIKDITTYYTKTNTSIADTVKTVVNSIVNPPPPRTPYKPTPQGQTQWARRYP